MAAVAHSAGMLKEHIAESDLTRAEWAKRLGIKVSYLSLLESGRRRPSLDLAIRIERETDGAVPAASWVEDAA